jgi:hypothetical protein
MCPLATTHHANQVADGIVLPIVGSGIRRSSAISRCTRRTPSCSTAAATPRAPRAYEQGIALTASAVERAELERRLGALR